MKKILIFFLLAAMVVSFVACKDSNDKSDDEEKTYTFTSGTIKIAIHDDAMPVLAALGEWRDYAPSNSCLFVGTDKLYTYAGFLLQTYPNEGKDFVFMISFYDDTVATEEGIRIGNTQEDVIKAYGTPDEQDATCMRYKTDVMYLEFLLTDEGTVRGIKYCHPKALENESGNES